MRWLLIDATYLCHRAFHSMGDLAYNGELTGVAYGFLKELETQAELHGADRLVFAFDHGGDGHRVALDSRYKSSRRNRVYTEEEKLERRNLREQMERLRSSVLRKMGYRNLFQERGFEADDILAAVAADLPPGDSAVIISADKDLWQCLAHNVNWYSPSSKSGMTSAHFRKTYNLDPVMWGDVKALAGCVSDDVVGITGIGEKSAAQWFAGTLKPGSAKYKLIEAGLDVYVPNCRLTKLPFPGLTAPQLVADDVTPEKKQQVLKDLGIRLPIAPVATRRGFDL